MYGKEDRDEKQAEVWHSSLLHWTWDEVNNKETLADLNNFHFHSCTTRGHFSNDAAA